MDIVITEWALDAYLDLKHRNVFDVQYYKNTIRPDVELLRSFPSDPKFGLSKFWSPFVTHGFKMKWHQVGHGRVQLRLLVAVMQAPGDAENRAYLCRAYVKKGPTDDAREGAKLKRHINLISTGRYSFRGTL